MMTQLKTDRRQEEMIQRQANAYFVKAAHRSIWKRLKQRRTGRSFLRALTTIPSNNETTVCETMVKVNDITGSLNPGRAQDFDADFCPRKQLTQNRWLAAASQLLNGRSLPPIELVKTSQGYFISDGHHRVSVHKAIGRDTNKAIVVSC